MDKIGHKSLFLSELDILRRQKGEKCEYDRIENWTKLEKIDENWNLEKFGKKKIKRNSKVRDNSRDKNILSNSIKMGEEKSEGRFTHRI